VTARGRGHEETAGQHRREKKSKLVEKKYNNAQMLKNSIFAKTEYNQFVVWLQVESG